MTAATAAAKPDFAGIAGKWVPVGLTLFASAVFLDSLRFKFNDHINTHEIFGALDKWAASLGAPGLFGHTGLFSQYVIGSGELAASTLLLIGLTAIDLVATLVTTRRLKRRSPTQTFYRYTWTWWAAMGRRVDDDEQVEFFKRLLQILAARQRVWRVPPEDHRL